MSSPEVLQEFEDDGDWTERFIQEVQSKLPIYNTCVPEHFDRNLISRLWNEVYETMVPTWQEMTANQKSAKGKELQNKWRNLKTCFRRELRKQKHGHSGKAANKRRKYVYFDQLLFLLPTMADWATVSECSPSNTQEDNSENEDDSQVIQTTDQSQGDNFNNISQVGTSTQTRQPVTPTNNKQVKQKKSLTYEESLLKILKEKNEEVIDEDKSFLLSLVPSFKKLNDTQKLHAKMEFLSTLKRLTRPRQETSYHMPQGYGLYPNIGPQGFAGNYEPRPISSNNSYYNDNVRNYPSGSSTPNPVPSDSTRASRGSSFESASPLADLTDLL